MHQDAGERCVLENVGKIAGVEGVTIVHHAFLAHVPAKACPGLDPGWTPLRRQEHALLKGRPGSRKSALPDFRWYVQLPRTRGIST
jgi:hypothetical protein